MVLGAAWALVCSLVGASAVQAQQVPGPQPGPTRPVHALFGGVDGNPASTQVFDLNISVSGQANDNAAPPGSPLLLTPDPSNPWLSKSLIYSGLSAQAAYARRWSRGAFVASSGHGMYYYPGVGQFTDAIHRATVAVNAALSQRLSVQAAETVNYSPFYGLGMFPGSSASAAVTWNPLYGVTMRRNLQMTTLAEMSGRLTRRVSFSTEYRRQQMRFTEQQRSFTNQSVGGRLSMRLSRSLSTHAGYTEHRGDYGTLYTGGVFVTQHDIDAGVDYNRALPLGRRSTFRFTTGSTIYSTTSRTVYRILADANLNTVLGRSWGSHVEFRHGLQWIEGFPEPVFSDTVQAGLSGYVGPRVEILFDAGYSRGEPGLSRGLARLETYTGRTQVRVAISRFAALSANYFYYHYDSDPGFPLPPGMSRIFDRQSVRAGVDLWVPLLR
jgi:hypothetical protein